MHGNIRIGTAIAAAAAMLVLVGSAVAQTGQQSPGDLARGDALNKRYHLGKYSPAALAGPKPVGVTRQQWQADLARADALNRRYGLGSYATAGNAATVATPEQQRVVTVASDGFDWSAAGIGAGAAIGLCLLASGTFVVLRQTRRSQLTTTA